MKKALSLMLAFAMVIGTLTIVPVSETEAASKISGSFYWLGSDITATSSANGGSGIPTNVDTMYNDTKAITILDETATQGTSAWSGGTTYEHGLGVHPKNGAAGFTDFDLSAYDVNRFYAVCGMTNTTLKTTGVKFTLNASATGTSGTWVQLEISPEIKRGQSYVFDVDITGYKFLKLNINQVGTYESMSSAWGSACVYKSDAITLGSGYLTSGNNAAGTTQTSVNTNHNLLGHYATYDEATMTYANNSVSQSTLSGHPIKKIETSSPAKPAFTEYEIPDGYNAFHSTVGFFKNASDKTLNDGQLKFTVIGYDALTDGEELYRYESPAITRGQDYTFNVDLTGAKLLRLEVEHAGGNYANMDYIWANPYVDKCACATHHSETVTETIIEATTATTGLDRYSACPDCGAQSIRVTPLAEPEVEKDFFWLGSEIAPSGSANGGKDAATGIDTVYAGTTGAGLVLVDETATQGASAWSGGTAYTHGLGVHPRSATSAGYTDFDLNAYDVNHFYAVCGLTNTGINTNGAKFTLLGKVQLSDSTWTQLEYSPELSRGQTFVFDTDITGFNYLKLNINTVGAYSSLSSAWADACVYKANGTYLGSGIAISASANNSAGNVATTVDATRTLYGDYAKSTDGKVYNVGSYYRHSLYGHPQSASKAAYTEFILPEGSTYNQFTATVGFNNNKIYSDTNNNTLKFTVIGYDANGDEIFRYSSANVKRGTDDHINADITGAKKLRLEVAHSTGTYASANYVWANPYVSTCECENHSSDVLADVISERTCTEDGIFRTQACPECGAQSEVTVPAGHKSMEVLGTDLAATTAATGSLKYYHCDVCNKYFLDTDALFECTGADDPRLVLEKRTEALGYTAGYPTEAAVKENAVYLSDKIVSSLMAPAGGSTAGREVKKDLNWSGKTIAIGGVSYTKGLGIIPPMPFYADSYVLCDISETGANRFYSVVGMDGSAATTDTSAANYGNGIAYYVFGSKNVTTSTDRADYDLLACSGDLLYKNGGVLEADITDYKTLLLVNDVPTLVNYGCNGVWANASVYYEAPEIGFESTQLKLNEGLKYSFFAEGLTADDEAKGIKAVFTVGDSSISKEVTPTKVGDVYEFEFDGISPHMIAAEITTELYVGEEIVDTAKSTILDYLNTPAVYTENKALVGDLIVYAKKLWNYVDANNRWNNTAYPAIELPEWVEEKVDTVVPESCKKVLTANEKGYKFFSANVIVDYENTIKINFTMPEGGKLFVNGEEAVISQKGVYETGKIKALNFADEILFELKDADGNVKASLKYNIMSYAYAKQSAADETLAALVKAIYEYGIEAQSYKLPVF